MKSPWKSYASMTSDRDDVVLASSIPPLRRSSTFRLFRGASAVRAQLERTGGLVGFSLLARPWRKQYATLSVRIDAGALDAFVASLPHRDLMGDLASEMGATRFVRWTIPGTAGRPTWSEALGHLTVD